MSVYSFIFVIIAESVSRMIADLPPKRVTRRLVFETPNGNNQATINSVSISFIKQNIFSLYVFHYNWFLFGFSSPFFIIKFHNG